MTHTEQLEKWVAGNPVHNGKRGDPNTECCPDFSCCGGEIADLETRQRFQKAFLEGDRETKNAMLGIFLGKMLASHRPNVNVYLAGDAETSRDN